MQRQHGLTLLELLVVLAIIGLAFAGVSLSLRDNGQTQLQREAQRLIAMLEAARAQSRTSGIALIWQTTPTGFVIRPAQKITPSSLAPRIETWLTAGTQAEISADARSANSTAPTDGVVLGPEPLLSPVHITLRTTPTTTLPTPTLRIGTHGLQPFHVEP